ncbi:ABC transporter substrate-binding protein [Vibrio tapetis]|uniref:ABC transporter, periplasmic substrate-binding protein n=1 Tax=Vibrio tapetis subsp. tapetis TaxID=1671868 RepID=A0A2N8ZLX1_9VIBR|nr:ABC transporter substrate-binding protein [Vibrio tapetis]SON52876.1 ABC transporter, periplasmic substrate-binding protein [Vibrio tapetis subsp. tapetis]
MNKKWILLLLLTVAAAATWFIQPNSKPTTLAISGPFEFNSQDMSKDGFLFSRLQVVEALVGINENAEPFPLLAKSWTQSEDGLTWRFTIRDNVNFHNGTPLTSESVVESLNNAKSKPGVMRHVPVQSIAAENGDVVISLTKPYRPLPSVLAHYTTAIVTDIEQDETGIKIAGTGPYQLKELTPPHKATVSRNDGYWKEKAKIGQVSYLAGHRTESRTLLAQSGQADIVYTVDPVSMTNLQQAENLNLHVESMPRTVLIKLNNEHKFLNHADIRKAISLAIDRDGIANSVLRLPGSQAYQLFSPALGAWHADKLPTNQRELAEAKRLMLSQGWALNSEQLLEKNGETFKIQLITYSDRPELPLIATALQAQLRELGVDMQISIDNSSAVPAKHHDGTLEMALIARNFGTLADPLPLLMRDFATKKGSGWGPTNWESAEFSQILNQLSSEMDQEHYRELSTKAARLLANEMPLIPVTYYRQLVAVNKRVSDFTFDPFEINYRISEMQLDD